MRAGPQVGPGRFQAETVPEAAGPQAGPDRANGRAPARRLRPPGRPRPGARPGEQGTARGDRRRHARGVDGDGDARRSETNDRARSTRLSTANQKRAALLDLGHRSDHGDDGRRTADDGLHASSDLGREEEDGGV